VFEKLDLHSQKKLYLEKWLMAILICILFVYLFAWFGLILFGLKSNPPVKRKWEEHNKNQRKWQNMLVKKGFGLLLFRAGH
jgi:hypothetical protein